MENGIIEPEFTLPSEGSVDCRERLGGLLRYYLPRGRVIQGDLNFRTLRDRKGPPFGNRGSMTVR